MSRTYRNKARFTHLNEAHYIEERLKKFNIRYNVEHFWLPGMEENIKKILLNTKSVLDGFTKDMVLLNQDNQSVGNTEAGRKFSRIFPKRNMTKK